MKKYKFYSNRKPPERDWKTQGDHTQMNQHFGNLLIIKILET